MTHTTKAIERKYDLRAQANAFIEKGNEGGIFGIFDCIRGLEIHDSLDMAYFEQLLANEK